MTDYTKVYNGISKVIWGYLFLHFHINIGTISILPSFVGYIFFSGAINLLKDEERELSLLKPLGMILGIWEGIQWFANFVGYSFGGNWQFVTLIIGLLNLYFHFQFITNLASIAIQYQQEGCTYDKSLLTCRTILTILQTVLIIFNTLRFFSEEIFVYISLALGIIFIIASIGIMTILNQLRKHLKYDEEMIEEDIITE